METYYLVDFENVHDAGVKHIHSLTKDNHIHIFYTKNAYKISMDIAFADVNIKVHKVSAGDESLDKHLLSYLGYLLGKDRDRECKYIIISKDKGYDSIIKFWHKKGYENISREVCIPESEQNSEKEINKDNMSDNKLYNRYMSHPNKIEFIYDELCNKFTNQFTVNAICSLLDDKVDFITVDVYIQKLVAENKLCIDNETKKYKVIK